MTGLDNEFREALDEGRAIASTKESITYPSMQSAFRIRSVIKKLLYIIDQRTVQDAQPYMPTMDEVYRFMASNPSTSAEMLFDIQKPKPSTSNNSN